MIESYENDYITNLLNLNKSLRDQIENLYSLLKKKIKIDLHGNFNTKLENILHEMEIVHSNFCLQMQTQHDLVTAIKSVDLAILKQKETNEQKRTINDLDNMVRTLKSEFDILRKENETLTAKVNEGNKHIDILKKENLKIIEENVQLKKENSQLKSNNEEINCEEMMNNINVLSEQLENVENKYKKQLEQKDLIISKLDEHLQLYEKDIQDKNTQITQLTEMLNAASQEQEENINSDE